MLLLFGLIFFVARTSLLDGYAKLEKDKTLIQLNSATKLLNLQSEQVVATTRDNAHWDDMYAFMAKPNAAFLESSYNDTNYVKHKSKCYFYGD